MLRQTGIAAALFGGTIMTAGPAMAQDDGPRNCPDRPGLGSSTCSTEPGRLSVEIGIGGWTIDKTDDARSDSVSVGDSFLRYGVDDKTEVQLGFTAYTHNYERTGDVISEDGGFSDIRLGVRRNLLGNDGGDVALAVEPYVTLPVGDNSVSADDWSAGVVVPASFSLGSGFGLGATSIAAASVDADGDGRHFSATEYLGIAHAVGQNLSATAELGLTYDDDPSGDSWAPVASISVGWTPRGLLQLDAGTVVGLDDDSPDVQVYIGISKLF
ncbi:transporter [Novosphingopyxis sp.]|uniref:transporter n=1 Tax=Novosphingopyxis sp. TaxID=2709690 RepID=UPI003B5BA854